MRGDTTQMKAWSVSHTRAAILQPPITGCRRLAISKIQVHKPLSLSLLIFFPPDIFIGFLHPSSIETILALKLWILDSESEILDPDGEQGEIGGEGEGEDTQPQRQQPIVQNNSSHLR
jgi:hypothetical protein